jgi:glycosyltransferase involved in cell wall biosynthesis
VRDEPRVLLSAYQCGPGMGSVSQIGWEWYSRLARRTEVTLVTHVRNREALANAGAPLAGSRVIFIDTEWFAGPLYRTASRIFPKSQHAVFLISSLDYFLYDNEALKLLRTRRDDSEWDVIHAPTPVSPMAATRLHRLGLPLIVGPWNGGLGSPRGFQSEIRADSGWIYRLRDAGRLIDRVARCTERSQIILSATKATDESVPRPHRKRIQRMIENGVDLELFHPPCTPPARPSATEPLQVLFVGRLIPVKGVSLLLRALVRVKSDLNVRLTIVGDGPCRTDIEVEVKRLDLDSVVMLTGNLPLPDVAAKMRKAHLFCLPSIRESGGAVLLEAMACGVPAVGLNYGGPAEILSDEVGRLLPADHPEVVTQGLVDVMRDAVQNPGEWLRRGQAGRKLVERRFGWDAKIDRAIELYRETASTRSAP